MRQIDILLHNNERGMSQRSKKWYKWKVRDEKREQIARNEKSFADLSGRRICGITKGGGTSFIERKRYAARRSAANKKKSIPGTSEKLG